MADSDDRWAELAERVDRLERRIDASDPSPASADTDTFWVLKGLSERVGQPAVVFAGAVELPGQRPVEWQIGHLAEPLLQRDWSVHASSLSALGHPVRLQILQLVATGEATTASQLSQSPDLGSTGQIYHHLRQLVAAGWLRTTTRGQHVIPPERVVPLLVVLAAST